MAVAGASSAGVTRYRPRTEGLFARINHHREAINEETDAPHHDYWEVRSKDGLISLYGTPRDEEASDDWEDPAAVLDPGNPHHIFTWKLSSTVDPFGNRIEYSYQRDDLRKDGPHEWDQLYISQIRYADYIDAEDPGETQFLVTVNFEYDERPDPFSEYRAGFEIRTVQRCTKITVSTNTDTTRVVRTYSFTYRDELDLPEAQLPPNRVSLLHQVLVEGHDGELTQAMPPLEFGYTAFEPAKRRYQPLSAPRKNLPGHSLSHGDYELADLFGNGLPDIFQLGDAVRYWKNLGNGQFAAPRDMTRAPAGLKLADSGVQLADMNGDGRIDLLVSTGVQSGYYPLSFQGGFDQRGFVKYRYAPSFNLEAPDVRFLDLDGDGVIDALRTGVGFELFYNDKLKGWDKVERRERKKADVFPDVSFQDPRVKLADMSGDGLQDMVLVQNGRIDYWPYLGYGRWAKRITMSHSPRFADSANYAGTGFDPKRLLLGDVDGDGLADMVYVGSGQITVWINQAGNGWSDPITVHGTPVISDIDAVRLTDMLGTGTAGILWTYDFRQGKDSAYKFLDLTGGLKPYLLHQMDNHMGSITRVDYAPSTRFYLEDQKKTETRWKTDLPFPVQVVAHVEVVDVFSSSKLTTEYRYHHGYWDGAEREFRGFGRVDQRDTQSFYQYHAGGLISSDDFVAVPAQHFGPPTETRTWFHQGPVGDEFGAWGEADFHPEYWPGDGQALPRPASVSSYLNSLPRRVRRDAIRTLRGRVLRTELYALDRTDRQDRPYTVTEHLHAVAAVASNSTWPVTDATSSQVFLPQTLAERTTQWERGDDPLTALSFTSDFDDYGQPQSQVSIAVPRGRNYRVPDEAGTPYFATFTATTHAVPDEEGPFIMDRVSGATSWEVVNDGSLSALELRDAILAETSTLQLIGQTVHYYDGDAFTGAAWGSVGDYGALVRTDTLVFTQDILEDAYRSGDAVLESPELPPYLSDPADWTSDYPQPFRDAVPALAGYTYQESGEDSPYQTGYFASTALRQYDFQEEGVEVIRGLLTATRDPLGNQTSIAYDDTYQLLAAEVTDPVGLTTSAGYDYRVLQPALVTDPNGNRTAYTYSPLGLPASIAVMGKDEEEVGDTLEQPGTVFQYALTAYDDSPEDPQPVYVHVVKRIQHRWDLIAQENAARLADSLDPLTEEEIDDLFPSDELEEYPERFIQSRVFSDGFGRILQTRAQAEDVIFGETAFGDSSLSVEQSEPGGTAEGQLLGEDDPPRVTVSGWQVYDNKGQVVEKYEPFFASDWDYAPAGEEEVGEKVTIYYDPRGHAIRTVNPDSSEQRVLFGVPEDLTDPDQYAPTPWESYTYDANDNAGRTHESSSSDYSDHWDTPASSLIDALGRTIEAIQRNGAVTTDAFKTRSTYDIRGNLLTVIDPLSRVVFQHVYDLANRPWRIENIDAGVKRIVLDAAGNELERRDSKEALLLQSYDLLHRPSLRWARDAGEAPLTLRERLEYGDAGDLDQDSEDRDAAAALNALARPVKHYEEAGLLTFDSYDFKGNLLEKTRQTIADAALLTVFADAGDNDWVIPAWQVDWQPGEEQSLEDRAASLLDPYLYQTTLTFDALNRVTTLLYPEDVEGSGNRKLLAHRYNRAGALEAVTLAGATYVQHIAYNAKGQRILIAYGNGIMTRYAYHTSTFRLARLCSERFSNPEGEPYIFVPDGESDPLQDLGYAYDLSGNPLSITDLTPGCGVQDNPDSINAPSSALASLMGSGDALIRRFAYDPLYRLVSSTGREDSSIAAPRVWGDAAPGPSFSTTASTANQDNAPTLTTFYKETYDYDPAGNMTKLRHSNPGATTDNIWVRYMGMGGTNYADWSDLWPDHQADDDVWDEAPGNRLTHVGDDSDDSPQSHHFDDNGNLVIENVNRHFEWDHSDRMRVFRNQEDEAEPTVYAFYLYDASGQRVKKLVRKQGGQLEATVYVDSVYERHYQRSESDDPEDPNEAENNTLHVMDNQSRVALVRVGDGFDGETGPAVQYHMGDHLGSSVVVLDDAGTWVSREEFSAYGDCVFGGFARKRYRFTGKERDEESGLNYHGARYYAPWLARWVSCDPAGGIDGLNVYSYVTASPLLFRDSTGLRSDSDLGAKNDWATTSHAPSGNPPDPDAVEVVKEGGRNLSATGVHDAIRRDSYKANNIKASRRAVEEIHESKKAGDIGRAWSTAKGASAERNIARTITQKQSGPLGRIVAKLTDGPRRFDVIETKIRDKLQKAGVNSEFAVAKWIAKGAGKSNEFVSALGRLGKLSGASFGMVDAVISARSLFESIESGNVSGIVSDVTGIGSGTMTTGAVLFSSARLAMGGSLLTSFSLGFAAGSYADDRIIPRMISATTRERIAAKASEYYLHVFPDR